MKRFLVRLAFPGLLLVALATQFDGNARAAWPPQAGDDLKIRSNQPNDPDYPGRWNYFSYIPPEVQFPQKLSEYERMIGSGFHADQAWIKTTGNPKILIAEID